LDDVSPAWSQENSRRYLDETSTRVDHRILIIGAYLGTPTKGDDTPKERTYVGIFYCLHSKQY